MDNQTIEERIQHLLDTEFYTVTILTVADVMAMVQYNAMTSDQPADLRKCIRAAIELDENKWED
jgi:hypothetical protein